MSGRKSETARSEKSDGAFRGAVDKEKRERGREAAQSLIKFSAIAIFISLVHSSLKEETKVSFLLRAASLPQSAQ